jgi:hypothetical protein
VSKTTIPDIWELNFANSHAEKYVGNKFGLYNLHKMDNFVIVLVLIEKSKILTKLKFKVKK